MLEDKDKTGSPPAVRSSDYISPLNVARFAQGSRGVAYSIGSTVGAPVTRHAYV